jgi:hypothetical protein
MNIQVLLDNLVNDQPRIILSNFNSTNTFSSHSAIFSIVSIQGPSELPCPGKSIDNTLKFFDEKNCSDNDQTIWERPLPCKNTIVSLLISSP